MNCLPVVYILLFVELWKRMVPAPTRRGWICIDDLSMYSMAIVGCNHIGVLPDASISMFATDELSSALLMQNVGMSID